MAILVLTTNNPIQETLFKNRITTSSADWLTPRNDKIPQKSEFGGTESGDIRKLVWSGALKLPDRIRFSEPARRLWPNLLASPGRKKPT